ncbi:MAG: DUF4145 domain-containing protein, partial [Myxococcota bacterium]|nr:DUF4145 domain-containing protein [Myxococcota bacterium]
MEESLAGLAQRVQQLEQRLLEQDPALRRALEYVQDDPKASLNKSRMVLERIVKEVYRRELGEDPRKRSIGEILSSKPFRDKVSSRVLKWMGVVQDWGNQGSHADGVSIYADDARVALEALAQVLGWYCDEYRKCTAGQERASSAAPGVTFPGAQPTPTPLPGAAPTPLPGATPTSLPVSTPTPLPGSTPSPLPAPTTTPAARNVSTVLRHRPRTFREHPSGRVSLVPVVPLHRPSLACRRQPQ